MLSKCRAGITALCLLGALAHAQQRPPIRAESRSTVDYSAAADGSETVEIRNSSYEVTGTQVPGRPPGERLLLRKTVHSKQALGDIGMEATVTLEAWRLGVDPQQKPLYNVTVAGADAQIVDNALWVVSRGLEETEWWSIYKLGSGQHLFDTYVPLLSFSISRETVTTRYVGLEVPPDDTKDARLKRPNVVGVLTYAAEDRIVSQAFLTCDDPKPARLLRSYADTTRTVSFAEGALKLTFSQNYPSPANTVELRIPLHRDDLDLAHAQLPPRMHLRTYSDF
ncbi:MAG TPA: hypothetical protein VN924_19995 [Bryobacteraceae bacterium]|nr:hypothetical protein [Bryobacteraceae bacterium]